MMMAAMKRGGGCLRVMETRADEAVVLFVPPEEYR